MLAIRTNLSYTESNHTYRHDAHWTSPGAPTPGFAFFLLRCRLLIVQPPLLTAAWLRSPAKHAGQPAPLVALVVLAQQIVEGLTQQRCIRAIQALTQLLQLVKLGGVVVAGLGRHAVRPAKDRPAAARLIGAARPLLGQADQFVAVFGVAGVSRHPGAELHVDADRFRLRASHGKGLVVEGFTQRLGRQEGFFQGVVGVDYQERVADVAGGKLRPLDAAQVPGDPLQQSVGQLVAVRVLDLAEAVDVQASNRDDALTRFGDPVDDLVDPPFAGRALEMAGDDFGLEFVRHRLPILVYEPV
jgi:hypothetical protein